MRLRTIATIVPIGLIVVIAHRSEWPAVWADWLDTPLKACVETLAIAIVVGSFILLLRPSWRRSGERWRIELRDNPSSSRTDPGS